MNDGERKMTRKTISRRANSKGTVFALVSDGVNWEVWKLCTNYCGQVRGGLTKHGAASRQQWASRRRVTCSPAESKGRNDERNARTNPGAASAERRKTAR